VTTVSVTGRPVSGQDELLRIPLAASAIVQRCEEGRMTPEKCWGELEAFCGPPHFFESYSCAGIPPILNEHDQALEVRRSQRGVILSRSVACSTGTIGKIPSVRGFPAKLRRTKSTYGILGVTEFKNTAESSFAAGS